MYYVGINMYFVSSVYANQSLSLSLSLSLSFSLYPFFLYIKIMGLCDNLGHCLGDQGYNAHKLVLFGDFSEVFPWLLRRLDENQDVMGATVSISQKN